jgi:hypothetical protein
VGHLRHARRQPSAGARPADDEAIAADAQLVRGGGQPVEGRHAVVEPGGERVLGGESVVDALHHEVELDRQLAAQVVVAVGRPHDQAAAVDPQQRRRGPARPSRSYTTTSRSPPGCDVGT